MTGMNRWKIVVMLLFVCLSFPAAGQVAACREVKMPGHPRLLLTEAERSVLCDRIRTDSTWLALHREIVAECDRMIDLPVLERTKIGMRLLAVSREALRRIFFLSYAYRTTGAVKYFDRAEAELLAVCRFADWNPGHFLDVAEMLVGVSIGYDWLYDRLPDESKRLIAEAIVKKGIEPSTDSRYNWWLEAKHNWNQVCNAGVTFGALAVYEHDPFRFQRFIDRGLVSLRLSMKDYDPDGAYAEGYSYWEYGTTFNVLCLSAVEQVFHTDFGLSAMRGFSRTASYYEHMVGVTGDSFNYADCGTEYGLTPAMFWFARKTGEPSLLWLEKDFLKADYRDNYLSNRVLPAALLWGAAIGLDTLPAPKQRMWNGGGTTPVSLMRTSWSDPNALFVGIKGGTASSNHAHMDAGSFVMEADGVRWAEDLGRENYELLESNGLHIWTNGQHSDRWRVLRYHNRMHNTLTVNDSLHRSAGHAAFTAHASTDGFMASTLDLSSVFEGELQTAVRSIAIVEERYVVVTDTLTACADHPATVRWTMLTSADVRSLGSDRIELRKDGKRLVLQVESSYPATMKTWSAQSQQPFDSPNPGKTPVGFEVEIPAGKQAVLTVRLLPHGAKKSKKEPALWGRMK